MTERSKETKRSEQPSPSEKDASTASATSEEPSTQSPENSEAAKTPEASKASEASDSSETLDSSESSEASKPSEKGHVKERTDRQLLRRLWPYAQPNRLVVYAALAITPLTMVLALLQPWLLKQGIDQHIVVGKLDGLQLIAGLYLGVVILAYMLEASYTMALAVAGQKTILRLRKAVYEHLISMAPSFFDNRPAGALLTRATSDVEALGETLTSGVITIVLDVLMVLGILSAMFWLHWKLTLVLLTIAPPLLWVLALIRRQLRACFTIIRDSLAAVNAFLAERIAGIEVVQYFNHEKATHEQFVARNTVYRDATIRSNIFDASMYAIVDGVGTICIAMMLWFATSSWFTAEVSIGLLVAFISYLQMLFRPLQEFSGKIAIIQRATTALDKIFMLLDDDEKIAPGEDTLPAPKGTLQMQDVHFGYKPNEDILKGVSMEVSPGEVVAIVGHSGSGKTTLIRLLTRSYDGYRGSITLDGKELQDLSTQDVRSAVCTVQQDIHLFSETVRFNICLDNPDISEPSMEQAATLVNAKPFIEQLPEAWQHTLRERGTNLSAGQGQLLTFARTMAHDPTVVILDEATASIDSKTEALVQDAIARIFERKTVIVIAHRLSTITSADRILVMEKGRIIEEGDHQQLLARDGTYAQMFRKGFAGT